MEAKTLMYQKMVHVAFQITVCIKYFNRYLLHPSKHKIPALLDPLVIRGTYLYYNGCLTGHLVKVGLCCQFQSFSFGPILMLASYLPGRQLCLVKDPVLRAITRSGTSFGEMCRIVLDINLLFDRDPGLACCFAAGLVTVVGFSRMIALVA